MNENQIRDLLPAYLEGELTEKDKLLVEEYLSSHPIMQEELKALRQTWEILGELPPIEPHSNFVSRFWTELSLRRSWHEKVYESLRHIMASGRWVPGMVTACILVIVGVIAIRNYQGIYSSDSSTAPMAKAVDLPQDITAQTEQKETIEVAVGLPSQEPAVMVTAAVPEAISEDEQSIAEAMDVMEDMELLEDMELVENFDILEDIELLEDLEYIEEIDDAETQT